MTVANQITVVRILLIPVFVIFAVYYGESVTAGEEVRGYRIAALVVFALASLSDGIDGFIARRFHQRSRLGTILDPIADKALLLTAIVTLSFSHWHAVLPLWFSIIVIARDVTIVGGVAVIHVANHYVEFSPHWTSKVCTALQMSCVIWVLVDFREAPAVPAPLIWITGLFTVVSGIVYILEGIRQLKETGHAQAERPGEEPKPPTDSPPPEA